MIIFRKTRICCILINFNLVKEKNKELNLAQISYHAYLLQFLYCRYSQNRLDALIQDYLGMYERKKF